VGRLGRRVIQLEEETTLSLHPLVWFKLNPRRRWTSPRDR
jgi:hypothetical protein